MWKTNSPLYMQFYFIYAVLLLASVNTYKLTWLAKHIHS